MSASGDRPLDVAAITLSAELGGPERVLLDFAERAFESDVRLTVVAPRPGPLLEALDVLGIPTRVVPAPRSLRRAIHRELRADLRTHLFSPTGLLAWARALRREPAVRQADLVYSGTFKAHAAAALTGRRPRVWHLHSYPPAAVWRWLLRALADQAIANSSDVGRAWTRRGTSTRVEVIPNGVDLDRFRPQAPTGWLHRRLGISPGARLVGMPAVYTRWKGQVEVLAAFERITAQLPDVHLVIAGGPLYDQGSEGAYGRELEARASGEWRLPGDTAAGPLPNVHFTGFLPNIEAAYPEFALTVHYSILPEPFGRIVLESLACGVPVLAADEGGPREIVRVGETGWLVAPRDTEALAESIVRALALPGTRLQEMGRAGREDAEDRFSGREFARRVSGALWRTWEGSG